MFGGLLLSKTYHRAAKRYESNKRQQQAAKRSKEKQKAQSRQKKPAIMLHNMSRFPFLAQTGLCWKLLGPKLAQVGLKLAQVGLKMAHMGPLGRPLGPT